MPDDTNYMLEHSKIQQKKKKFGIKKCIRVLCKPKTLGALLVLSLLLYLMSVLLGEIFLKWVDGEIPPPLRKTKNMDF